MRMATADLTTGPLRGHVLRLAGPVAIGYFFNTLYTLGDAFFAGRVSVEAQAALGLSFPPLFLMIALSIGFAQANGALIANAIGAGDQREGNRITGESITLSFIASLLMMLFLALAAGWLLTLAGAEGETLRLGQLYIGILIWQSPIVIVGAALNGALNAQGDTKTYGIALAGGAVINLALNALFALVLGWGLAGIAIATLIAQSLGAAYFAYKFFQSDIGQTLKATHLRPTLRRVTAILLQAVPAVMNMFLISAGYFLLNRFFAAEGTAAVAGFLVVARVAQLVMLPAIGLNVAAMAIIGQNFGAGKIDRVHQSYRLLIAIGISLMVVGAALLLIFGKSIVGLFTDDSAVLEVANQYIFFAAIQLPLLVVVFVSNGAVLAVKRAIYAPLTNLLRLIVLPLIFITLFQQVFGMGISGIWYGEMLSYGVVGLFALVVTQILLTHRGKQRALELARASA